MENEATDARFERAVQAIDAGDVASLKAQLRAHPELTSTRLMHPGEWLRSKVGNALQGFFREPYLLWFVAEDPVRNGTLPPNIAAVAQSVIDATPKTSGSAWQEQLDYTLTLVAWSWIARDGGVQIALIDTLIDAGASPLGTANKALVNKNIDAARHLLARGDVVTIASAASLGEWDALDATAHGATPGERSFALVLASLNRAHEGVARLLALGADPSARSEELYPHGTPLHHAVSAGSMECVRLLVHAGADVRSVDTAFGGTPRGWANYYLEQARESERDPSVYAEIARFLREREKSS